VARLPELPARRLLTTFDPELQDLDGGVIDVPRAASLRAAE